MTTTTRNVSIDGWSWRMDQSYRAVAWGWAVIGPFMASPRQSLLAGSMAGMASVVVCHPLDTIRTRLQAHPERFHGFFHCIQRTIRQESWRGLYKGFWPPLWSQALYKSIIFTISSQSQPYLSMVFQDPSTAICASGMLAGGINAVLVCPVEFTRNRLQIQYTDGPHAFRQLYAQAGLRGWWRGLAVTMWRDSLGVGAYLLGYHWMRQRLDDQWNRDASYIVSGAWGGICFWALALPFDTIKTIVQVTDKPSLPWYRVGQNIVREYGLVHLFRGWQAAFSRGIPGAALTFWTYERLLPLLQRTFPERSWRA